TSTCVSGIGTDTVKVCVILNTPFVYNVVIPLRREVLPMAKDHMTIETSCPNCGKRMKITTKKKHNKCPRCKLDFVRK
ncbi:hypothetical protein WL285_13055, partial [Staphylococcus warneri]